MRQCMTVGALVVGVCSAAVLMGCSAMPWHEDETKVAFVDVPQVVQAALAKEAEGGAVGTVEKEVKHGRTVYEADVTIKGKRYEISVAEDGTLIKKQLEHGDKDKD